MTPTYLVTMTQMEATTSIITKTLMETTDKSTISLINQTTADDNQSTNTHYEMHTLIGSTRKPTSLLTTQYMVKTPNLQTYNPLNLTKNNY